LRTLCFCRAADNDILSLDGAQGSARLALLPGTVGQRVVEAVFPPQRISGKKFQKIGLASST
jgi:hypothetical protein